MDTFQNFAKMRARLLAEREALERATRVYTPPPLPIARGSSALKQSVAPRPAINAPVFKAVPPPPPSLSDRIAANIRAVSPEVRGVLRTAAPVYTPPPVPAGARALKAIASVPEPVTDAPSFIQDAESLQESWTLWQTPDGTDVAMPSSYTPPQDWSQQAELTEPDQIENARNSPIGWDNQPVEVQQLVNTNERGPIYNDGQSPLWIGDDQTRMAEEARSEDAGNRVVTGQIRQLDQMKRAHAKPISIESDFIRQNAEALSASQSAPQSTPVAPVASQPNATPETPVVTQLPGVGAGEQYVVVRLPDGVIRAFLRSDYESDRFAQLYPEARPIGGIVNEETANRINANEELMTADRLTGMERGDDRQISARNIYPQIVNSTWGDQGRQFVDWIADNTADGVVDVLKAGGYFEERGGALVDYFKDIAEAFGSGGGKGMWNAALEAIPDWGMPDWLEDFTIPGTDISFDSVANESLPALWDKVQESGGDAVVWWWENVIVGPQKRGTEYSIDFTYHAINGTADAQTVLDDKYGAGMSIFQQVAELVPGIGSPAEWMRRNPEQATQLYEQGVDTDGDGVMDLTGAEAVHWYWTNEVANGWQVFGHEVLSDPWNATMALGGLFGLVDDVARSRYGNDASRAGQFLTRLLEAIGVGGRGATRTLEGIGSGGMEFLPDLLKAGFRRIPLAGRLLDDSGQQVARGLREGFEIATESLPSSRRAQQLGARRVADLLSDGLGNVTGVRYADNTRVLLTQQQADDLTAELVLSAKHPERYREAATALKSAGIAAENVPPRYLVPLEAILKINPGRADDIARIAVDTAPEMQHHVVSMRLAYGRGRSFPDAAIDTSREIAQWRTAFEGFTLPDYAPSISRQSQPHAAAETIIHTAWDSTENRAARASLYPLNGTNQGMRRALPSSPSDSQIAHAERYASLVEEHLRWNPDALSSPKFKAAYDDAVTLRERLAETGYSPRQSYSRRPGEDTQLDTGRGRNPRQVSDATAPADATATPEEVVVAPADASPATLARAVEGGIIAREDTLDFAARLFHWDDADVEAVIAILDDLRLGIDGVPPVSADQLNTIGGRGLLNDINNLLDKRRAVTLQDSIAARADATPRQKKQARDLVMQRRKEIEALSEKIGLVNGSARTRIKQSKRIVPERGSKAARQYAGDIERLVTKRHMTRSRFHRLMGNESGMVIDEGGMAYLATPFGDIPLTPEQLAELTRHTFDNGDTSLDRWIKHINANANDPRMSAEDIIEKARVRTRDDLHKHLKDLYPTKEPGILGRLWDGYTEYLRNQILGSWISLPRYWSNTTFGNMGNLVLGGYGLDAYKVLDMRQVVRNANDLRRTMTTTGADPFVHNPEVMSIDRIANTFNTSRAPEVRHQIRSDHVVGTATPIEAFFGRHGFSAPFKGAARATTGDSRGLLLAQGMDMQMRDVVYTTAFNRKIRQGMGDFRKAAKARLTDAGLDDTDAAAILSRFHQQYPTGFNAGNVRANFRNHLPDGMADRLARDWQSTVTRIDKHARTELTRVTFAGRETNLDAAVRRYVMFSYFMSRQYNFLIKQGLRHPGLINAYLNYQDATERYMEENPDLPKWMKGMVAIGGMPGFLNLMVNPTALWEIGTLFQNGVDVENFDAGWFEDNLGWVFQDNPYFFLHPGITAGFNLFGLLGDSRAFDPTNMGTMGRFFQLGENWLRFAGWLGDDNRAIEGNRVYDLGNQFRDWFTDKVDWIPGAEHLEYVESVGVEEAELRAIAWDEAEKMGLDPENNVDHRAWLDEQMEDPNSEMYQRSFRRYLIGETVALGAKLTPLVSAMRPIVRQQDRDGDDLMESLKALGNEEMKAFARTSDPQARAIDEGMDRYYGIGTRRQQKAHRYYTKIVYGEVGIGVRIDGRYYSPEEINAMSLEERQDLGIAFLVEVGVYDEWQEYQTDRDEFMADPENRAFAQQHTWQSAVRQYEGGIEGYWQDLIQHNPNARRYYEGLDPDLTKDEREDALLSGWAFMSVAGIQSNIYQPKPLETNFYDPVEIANKAPEAVPYEPYVSEYEKDTRKQVADYEREMKRADPVVRRIMSDWGIDPNTPYNSIYYRTRLDIADEYNRRTGKTLPNSSWDEYWAAEQYLVWVSQQPVGADTSLDAYFEEQDEQWFAGAPSRFNEDQDAEDDERSAADFDTLYRNLDPGYRREDEDDDGQP